MNNRFGCKGGTCEPHSHLTLGVASSVFLILQVTRKNCAKACNIDVSEMTMNLEELIDVSKGRLWHCDKDSTEEIFGSIREVQEAVVILFFRVDLTNC